MKHRIIFLLLCSTYSLIQAGYTPSTAPTTSLTDQMYLSSPLTANNHRQIGNLVHTVGTYPLIGVISDDAGNMTVCQGTQDRAIKAMTPAKIRPMLRNANLSILRPTPDAFKNYPSGTAIFPGYSKLSTKFDAMIADFKKNPQFISFFRKVHINILNELYHHLMSIYMNFNLQHAGIKQTDTGDLQVSIPLFLQDEETYAANSKTMIINQLVGVIESQFNGAIRSYAHIPHTFATFIGKTAIQNDYSVDLTQFIIQQLEPQLIKTKQTYLEALASYLSFFQLYTSYLQQPHSTKPEHFTAFVDIAEKINQFLYNDAATNQDKSITAIAKMNPPLFHFGYDDIRALQLLPHLAKTMPPKVQSIGWPSHILEAAQEGLILNIPGQTPHPLAYFRTADGIVVRNLEKDLTVPLYICMRLGENLFEQQLLPQPDWLNSWDGVAKILRACFGDFSAILGMGILDPCMEALVSNVVLMQQGKDPNAAENISAAATSLIDKWKKLQAGTSSASQIAAQNQTTFNIPSLPSLPSPTLSSTLTPPLLTQP